MNKRQFLATAVFSASSASTFSSDKNIKIASHGPTLLTVTGTIGHSNRGTMNNDLDQLMHKQNVHFDKAYTFNFATLSSLPAVTIKPTLPYDTKQHFLRGPLLIDVINATGAKNTGTGKILLRAIDGYAVLLTLTDIKKFRFIVALQLDGQPLPLGGLGPLWAVYDADRFSDMMPKPLKERFSLCPWGLYHIDLQT